MNISKNTKQVKEKIIILKKTLIRSWLSREATWKSNLYLNNFENHRIVEEEELLVLKKTFNLIVETDLDLHERRELIDRLFEAEPLQTGKEVRQEGDEWLQDTQVPGKVEGHVRMENFDGHRKFDSEIFTGERVLPDSRLERFSAFQRKLSHVHKSDVNLSAAAY